MIKAKVDEIVNKYGTNNPFEIAEAMGIIVLYENLGETLGYYSKSFRFKVIHINEKSSERLQMFACGHELGHAILHPDANAPFLKSATHFSTRKMEVEANKFAIELLFCNGRDTPFDYYEVVDDYGAPEDLLLKKFYG